MVRRAGVSLVVVVLLIASLAGAARFSMAQDSATPAAQGQSLFTAPGVQTSVLASGDTTNVAVPNPHLLLERITVPNGASTGLHTTAGPELLYVETGTVTFHDTFGFASTQTGPAHLLMDQSTGYSIENTSSAPASILRLAMAAGQNTAKPDSATATTAATPVAAPGASPAASPVPPVAARAVSSQILLDASSPEMQQGNVTLTIGRAMWDAGTSSGKQGHTGPLGVYVEQGTLNVTSPSGMEGQVPAGQSVVLPASVPLQAHNAQNDLAVSLIVTIEPTGHPAMAEIIPTPTPTIPPTATTIPTPTLMPPATNTPAPTPTTVPSPTPTPMPKAGTVLYEATGQDFSSWPKSEAWQYVDGLLVSTGQTNDSNQWVPAPYAPATADYAVETEIKVDQTAYGNRPFIAVVARGDPASDKGDVGGLDGNGNAYIAGQFLNELTKTGFDPGSQWHTYRVEVQGNVIRLLIDGSLVLQASNNTNLSPGRAGLFAWAGTQVSVRSFRVIALGERSSNEPQPERAAQATSVLSQAQASQSQASPAQVAAKSSAGPLALSSGQLAYSVKTGGHWDIWAHDFASNQNIQLTTDPNSDQWAPAYSHDGTKLAFLSDASGTNQVWLMKPDGQDQTQLSDWTGDTIRYVAWSGDDQRLYVTVKGDSDSRLMQMASSGGDLSDLIPPISGFAIAIPKRNQLLYVTGTASVQQIALASEADPTNGSIQYAGDAPTVGGDKTACQLGDRGGRQLVLRDLAGNILSSPPDVGSDSSNPALTSDGSYLLWVVDGGGPSRIMAWPTGGGSAQSVDVASNDQIWYVAWRPNS